MKTKTICKKALTFFLVFALVAVQMFSSSSFTQANTTEVDTQSTTTGTVTDDEWEEVYSKADTLEIRSNGNSTLFTGLEENSTYMLTFDMTVVDASSLLLVGLRSDATFTAGQYLQLGGGQPRVSSDYWSGTAAGATLYASGSMPTYEVDDVVAVKVMMNPTSVALYLDGALVQLYDHVNNDGYKDLAAVPSVANGSLLFGHNGGGTGIDVSNISLKKQLAEWGTVFSSSEKIELRNNGANIPYTGLEENSTYMLDFDMTLLEASSYLLVGLRAEGTYTAGQYLQLGNQQPRLSSDLWSGGAEGSTLYASGSMPAYTADDVVAVKVLMEPTSVALYLDGALVQLYDHVNNDGYKDAATVPSIANAMLGFAHNGSGAGIDVSNVVLKKKLPKMGTIFSHSEKIELRNNGANIPYTGLEENSTYMLDFDMTLLEASSYLLVGLRAEGTYTAGQYLQLGNQQPRLSSDLWSGGAAGSTLYASGSMPAYTADDVVAVKVIMNPTSVSLYLDGTLVKLYDHVNNDGYKETISVPSIANAMLGFAHNGSGTGIDVSNVVLRKEIIEEVETPVDPEPPVEDTTEWSENILANQADISFTTETVQYLDAVLDVSETYELAFDMNVKDTNSFLTVMLRDGSSLVRSNYWFYCNQIRNGTDERGFDWDSAAYPENTIVNPYPFSANTTFRVKYIIEPNKFYIYIDDTLVQVTKTSTYGYASADYTVTPRVLDGKVGFWAWGPAQIDISNITLKSNLAANIDQEEIDRIEALIDAIGTVTVDSKTVIGTARSAYETLGTEEKPLVENYDVLTAAEAAYAELIASKDKNAYGLDASYAMGGNYWGSAITVSDTVGGGMHFELNNDGVDMRQGVNKGVALDGLHAVFKGLNFTSSAKSIAFYLADKSDAGYSSINDDPLVLVLNTNAGTLSVIDAANANAETVIIAANDNLKYANIANIEWSIKMAKNEDGSYTINVAGAEGTITADMLDCASLTQTEEVYFTICAWDWAATTVGGFDFVSLHGGNNACVDDLSEEEFQEVLSVIEAIDAIGYVTKEDTDAVNAAMLAYAGLSEVQKTCVTNYDVLLNAMNQLSSLVSGLCNKYHSISADDFAGINHWTDRLITSDVEGGGANIKWIHAGKNYRQAINRKLSLDGLHMIFSGLEIAEDSQSKTMAIFFAEEITSYDAYYSEWVDGQNTVLALVFDFEAGTVYAHVGDTSQLIIANANLKYDSLKNAMWDLKINYSNGNYTVSVRNITGTLPSSLVSSASLISDTNDVRATFSPWGYCSISLNINSVHGNDRTCAESLSEAELGTIDAVIDGIDAIYNENNQITADAQAEYDTVIGQYNALSSNYQTMVYNYDKLTLAQQVLAVVNTIEGLTDISLSSESAINAARSAYKTLSIDGRKAVGNYSILNEAVRTLQRLKKEAALAGTDIFLKG